MAVYIQRKVCLIPEFAPPPPFRPRIRTAVRSTAVRLADTGRAWTGKRRFPRSASGESGIRKEDPRGLVQLRWIARLHSSRLKWPSSCDCAAQCATETRCGSVRHEGPISRLGASRRPDSRPVSGLLMAKWEVAPIRKRTCATLGGRLRRTK